MDQSAYTRKIRDTTRARGPRGPQASPYRDSAGSFMVSVAGGAAYVGCTNCDANAPVVPSAMVPDAPTDVSGTRGPSQVTVAFVPPVNDGGSAILYYTVLTTSGVSGETIPDVSGLSSPIVVSGLTNGAPYGFRVTATNSVGTSVPSDASPEVIPATVPGAPTIGTATGGNAQATVTFSASASTGGSPITAYRATSNPGGFTADASASPITVTGLTNGTSYTFRVTAINDVGTSPASAASNSVTPAVPVVGTPTLTYALADDSAAYIYFTAGTGTTPTNYEYTLNGGASYTAVSPVDIVSPIKITGLTNGTLYSVQLRAIVGSIPGTASNALSVTPIVLPASASWLEYDPSNPVSYGGTGTVIQNVGTRGPTSGTFNGSVTYNGAVAGGVLDFTGTNGTYIVFPTITFTPTITVCAWVYPRSKSDINGLLTNAGANVPTNGFKFQWNSWLTNSRIISFQAGNGTTGGDDSTIGNVVNYNTWQHFGYVFDQSNQRIVFFLNGEPVDMSTDTITVAGINLTSLFYIGGYAGGSYTMNAQLGSIKVFNTLLNAAQIRGQFNATRSRFGV